MNKSTHVIQKKRGRPITRAGDYDSVATVRLSRELGTAIDAWAEANDVRGRSEAIRQLVGLGLKAKATPRK